MTTRKVGCRFDPFTRPGLSARVTAALKKAYAMQWAGGRACRSRVKAPTPALSPHGRGSLRRGASYKVNPPSTMIVCPVIIAPPAHRKKIVSAMSSGLQARFKGVRSIEAVLRSTGQSLFHGLSTKPGATALTRISGANVRARLRVRLMSPALLYRDGLKMSQGLADEPEVMPDDDAQGRLSI